MEPIESVFQYAQKNLFNISSANVLEVFARDGDWHTKHYADKVKTLDVWEIDSDYAPALRKNLPNANIKICDSYRELETTKSKYDIVVVDNPQSIFGDGKYCEHFELIPNIFRVMNDMSILILNVNVEPYNFDIQSEWARRRKAFYRTDTPNKLTLPSVDDVYRSLCESNGWKVKWTHFVERSSFLQYYILCIQK